MPNVSTTNTYYIKSAADDTRAAMAKLERLLTLNKPQRQAALSKSFVSDHEVATDAADSKSAAVQ